MKKCPICQKENISSLNLIQKYTFGALYECPDCLLYVWIYDNDDTSGMSVRDKIKAGYYELSLPSRYRGEEIKKALEEMSNTFVGTKIQIQEEEENIKQRITKEVREFETKKSKVLNFLYQRFKKDAIDECGLAGNPMAEKMFEYARKNGRDNGYSHIHSILEDLSEMFPTEDQLFRILKKVFNCDTKKWDEFVAEFKKIS
jgi:hypothetical protein